MDKKITVISKQQKADAAINHVREIISDDQLNISIEHIDIDDTLAYVRSLTRSDLAVIITDSPVLPNDATAPFSAVLTFYADGKHILASAPLYACLFDRSRSSYGKEGREIIDETTISELAIEKVLRTAAECAETISLPLFYTAAGVGGATNGDFLLLKTATVVFPEYPDVSVKQTELPTRPVEGILCAPKAATYYLDKLTYEPTLGPAVARLYVSRYGSYLLNICSFDQKPRTVCDFLKKIIFDL